MKGTTKSGFKFNIDERIIEDWDFLEAIAMAESTDASEQIRGTMKVADMLLGKEKESLKKLIREKNGGYVPQTEMANAIAEIITSVKELKNSPSSSK